MSQVQTTTTELRPACHLQAAAGRVEDGPEQERAYWDDQKLRDRRPARGDPTSRTPTPLLAARAGFDGHGPKRWPPLHLLTTGYRT